MKKIIHRIPFFRLTAALAAGILPGSVISLSSYVLYGVLLIIAFFLYWIQTHYRFSRTFYFGAGVHLFFFCTGILLYKNYNKMPHMFSNGIFTATVKEILQEKPKTFQSVLELNSFLRNDSLFPAREKVMVYFEKDSDLQIPVPGQVIIFNASPQPLPHKKNPYDFDYRKYMAGKQIYRQIYLPIQTWKTTGQSGRFDLLVIAEKARMQLLEIYSRQNWNEKHLQVMSALTLGYRRGLDPETRQTFASAGILHILAVSGLHVGILFFVINFLFGFLRKNNRGRLFFVALVVVSLWGFAFLTGLSPSVNRAASMFTFLVVGQNLRRQLNVYNTLAASAFFLLLVNPNNLFDAGFQLSYAAVYGIVFLYPRLEKLFYLKFWLFRYLWRLTALSVSAQVATFPISVFYFQQFPVYFWFSNLLAIPAVTALIPLGLLLLAVNWIPCLSSVVSDAAQFVLNFLLRFSEMVESFPYSTAAITFTGWELALSVTFLLLVFAFIEKANGFYFKAALFILFLFLTASAVTGVHKKFRNEIIVYDDTEQQIVHLIAGSRNYVIAEKPLDNEDNMHRYVKSTVNRLQLDSPVILLRHEFFHDSVIYLNNGFILFNGKVLHFYHRKSTAKISPFKPDVIIGEGADGRQSGRKPSSEAV